MPDATPMMRQYWMLKAQSPGCLLFYRMGDFFELFFEDARTAARVLDIALTTRGEHEGKPVPMCGVPVHSAESYLARLIRAGERVAIAEQVETPGEAKARGGSKALVKRDIVRLVTAGTLTEEALLEPARANRLVALAELRGRFGIAACDISTGRMELEDCDADAVAAVLARIGASEIVVPEGSDASFPAGATTHDAAAFASARGEAALKAAHGVATLDGFGAFTRAMLAAAGGLLAYLGHAGRGAMPLLLPPVTAGEDAVLAMDESTRASLEITVARDGSRGASLLGTIDRCRTGAGSRLLADDLSAPLRDREAIGERLGLVAWLHDDPLLRGDLRDALGGLPDIARALGRLAAGRGSPRDLGQLRDGLGEARRIRDLLAARDDRPALLDALLPALTGHGALTDRLSRALVPSPPTEMAKGGYIAEGHDAALDELRATSGDARRAIAALEARYRDETGIATLKVKHNNVLGYFVEVPAARADPLMAGDSGFAHRQTLASAVRFSSVSLHGEATRIAEAGARALAAEEAHFEKLRDAAMTSAAAIARTAEALARLDVAASHAQVAAERDWCRPELVDEPCLEITGGRHPVVEAALHRDGARFVANDCALGPDDRLWLVGGPNMGGKSTFLRANALAVVLAQAGAFVPAQAARIGLADRLFSRVGASDDLARGRSTFMVEMVETAAILAQSTPRSFVILDEVGRGTSTYDGLAIAWAVAEAVHETVRCRCLFATHYHEMAALAESCEALSLHHVRAREYKGELVLLHEVAPGAAESSFGLAVARLAGLPRPVIARARAVLAKLEEGRERTGGIAAGLGELPLFAAAARDAPPASDPLRDRLAATDLDALSPRDALELLYRLKADCDPDGASTEA